jgi:hypothetical protein
MPTLHNSLVLYGFLLVVGGLLMGLRAADDPTKTKSMMLARVIIFTGVSFWVGSLLIDE